MRSASHQSLDTPSGDKLSQPSRHQAPRPRTVHVLLQELPVQLELSASVVTVAPTDSVRVPLCLMTAVGWGSGSTCAWER